MLIFINIIKSCLTLIILMIPLTSGKPWIDRIISDLKSLKTFQTILIRNDNYDLQNEIINKIIEKIQCHFPSQLNDEKIFNLKDLTKKPLNQDFETSLFIIINIVKNKTDKFSIIPTQEFLIKLTNWQIRPKCLTILLVEEKFAYNELLKKMWSQNFLDYTIMEIFYKPIKNSNFRWQRNKPRISIVYYNPFNDCIVQKKYRKKVQLFPNKLENLNGFTMEVASFHLPPFTFVKRNSTQHPVVVYGPDWSLIKTLGEKMNFKVNQIATYEDFFGLWICNDKSQMNGIAKELWNNKIRFIVNQGSLNLNCVRENRKTTGTMKIVALVPIFMQNEFSLWDTLHWLYLIVILITIKFTVKLLKIDSSFWSGFNILQLMLGMSTQMNLKMTKEKIIAASVLIAFLIFSSEFYAIISKIQLNREKEVMINTLEELNQSELIPQMLMNYLISLKFAKNSIYQVLVNKTIVVETNKKCLTILLKYKNVTCIMRDSVANLLIKNYLSENGEPLMRIVKQDFGLFPMGIYVEPSSPFVRSIDSLTSRLIDFGLVEHWNKEGYTSHKKVNESFLNTEVESQNFVISMMFTLIFGYLLSFIVFLGELLSKFSPKWKKFLNTVFNL